jgi:hypothetical protein
VLTKIQPIGRGIYGVDGNDDALAMSAGEWQTWCDLAACYRLIRFSWSDLLGTHISARVPGPEEPFPAQPLRPDLHMARAPQPSLPAGLRQSPAPIK